MKMFEFFRLVMVYFSAVLTYSACNSSIFSELHIDFCVLVL